MFWIHTQKPIAKDTILDDSTVGDHEAGGLIFKVRAPLILIVSLVSQFKLNFFDDIILNLFRRLNEENFSEFILHMHLITYKLANLAGIHQMTIKEIYFGYIIQIQPNLNYRSMPILSKKKLKVLNRPYDWNQLIDRKKVSVIVDTEDGVENVDVNLLDFMGIYGDFTRFMARKDKEEESEIKEEEESEVKEEETLYNL